VGRWGTGVDQPECGAGRASPAKWSNTNTGKKKTSQNVDRRAASCNLLGGAENDLLAIRLQSPNTLFSVQRRPYAQFEVLCFDAHHFLLHGAARNSALALH
jgi:hypothetical protein